MAGDWGEPVTHAAVAALLKRAGFAERTTRAPAPAEGFLTFNHEDGILVCWIPATGQDPGDLDALARSYNMAQAYATAAREAGWEADRWGVIWHYALITGGLGPMTTGRAIHRAEDGTETDITEGVQALYDLVISSMDWGSGFWSAEDALPVAKVGHLLGFAQIEEVDRYVAARKHEEESQAWQALNPVPVRRPGVPYSLTPVPHDHVFSSVGRCMWPLCEAWQD